MRSPPAPGLTSRRTCRPGNCWACSSGIRSGGAACAAGRRPRPHPAAGRDLPRRVAAAHCETAQRLSGRLGLPGGVSGALHAVFEHWDGSGFPDGRVGAQIPVPARFAQLSYDALLLHEHLGGIGRISRLTGACYDPDVVALLRANDTAEVAEIVSPWEAVLAAEPGGSAPLDSVQLDGACEAAADFADLKSPWLLGHSRGVAELAEAAAWRAGLDAAAVAGLRRAALLHDLGRVVVPSGIWDRPGPLRDGEWELVRLHAYHSERVLSRSPPPGLAGRDRRGAP
jgi:HD-GYP domain-containing protein (c-di-GMP phosphodiesterase class II)